jgi:hypothetical protein
MFLAPDSFGIIGSYPSGFNRWIVTEPAMFSHLTIANLDVCLSIGALIHVNNHRASEAKIVLQRDACFTTKPRIGPPA